MFNFDFVLIKYNNPQFCLAVGLNSQNLKTTKFEFLRPILAIKGEKEKERKREREKERKRAREKERKREREKERKREREQESKREREQERKRERLRKKKEIFL